jgi:hypothetical protein
MSSSAVWTTVLLSGLTFQALAEPLGRLLYSPHERVRMETARAAAGDLPESREDRFAARPTLNGLLTRSDGRRVMWLDGSRVDRVPSVAGAAHDRALRARVGRTLDFDPAGDGGDSVLSGRAIDPPSPRLAPTRAKAGAERGRP